MRESSGEQQGYFQMTENISELLNSDEFTEVLMKQIDRPLRKQAINFMAAKFFNPNSSESDRTLALDWIKFLSAPD